VVVTGVVNLADRVGGDPWKALDESVDSAFARTLPNVVRNPAVSSLSLTITSDNDSDFLYGRWLCSGLGSTLTSRRNLANQSREKWEGPWCVGPDEYAHTFGAHSFSAVPVTNRALLQAWPKTR
jgi:hypothetical protein